MRGNHVTKNGILVLKSLMIQALKRLEELQDALDHPIKGMHPEYIILHHSLTKDGTSVNWQAIRRYHVQELCWDDMGYHFGIEAVKGIYEIFTGRFMNTRGAHCIQKGMNRKSLGVCFVGNYDLASPTDLMWLKGLHLVSSLMEVFDIPVENVRGHNEFADYKSCPGKKFSVEQFRKDLI